MPKYIIERNLPGIGNISTEDLKSAARTSCDILRKMGPEIQWLHSYVANDTMYCIYIAPNENVIKQHAKDGGFPADKISKISKIIDPTTAE
ncbi:MAG: DUF4242 domain-containing protein [Sulfurimonas sp.]|nr:DUF4242 domain-containing protein [Sulfurimonas sp.]